MVWLNDPLRILSMAPTLLSDLLMVHMLRWGTTSAPQCHITSTFLRCVQILIVIVAIRVLTVINSRLLIEHVLVLDVFVQITEVGHVFAYLGLSHLHIEGLLDLR